MRSAPPRAGPNRFGRPSGGNPPGVPPAGSSNHTHVGAAARPQKLLRFETLSQNLTIEAVLGYVLGMDARAGSSAALFAVFEQLKKAWIKGGWSWDSRFSCVASSFNVELEAEARAVVLRFLPNEWGSKTIVNAPTALKE